MGRKKETIRNVHLINEIRVTTSASSTEEKPVVLIFKIDFDFTGDSDEEEYELFTNSLYDIFYKRYTQKRKIISIDIPEYNTYRFKKQKHHCKVEVYQLNTQNIPFDEFESIVLTDFMELFPQIKRLFKDFSFTIEKSKKRVKKDLVF